MTETFLGDRFHICWNVIIFLFSAHQDRWGERSGGEAGSVGAVDPQQVVGCHIQVMVTMGGGKHSHLPTERAGTDDADSFIIGIKPRCKLANVRVMMK